MKILIQFDDETSPPTPWVLVQVFSVVKPNVRREGVIDLPRKRLERDVMTLAGAIAEELCGQYGDVLDPDEIAHLSREGLRQCEDELKGMNKTFSFAGL